MGILEIPALEGGILDSALFGCEGEARATPADTAGVRNARPVDEGGVVKSSLAAKSLEALGYSRYALGDFATSAEHYEAYVALRAGVEDGGSGVDAPYCRVDAPYGGSDVPYGGSDTDPGGSDCGTQGSASNTPFSSESDDVSDEIYAFGDEIYAFGHELCSPGYSSEIPASGINASVYKINGGRQLKGEIDDSECAIYAEIDGASSSGVECSPLTPRPVRLEAIYAFSSKPPPARMPADVTLPGEREAGGTTFDGTSGFRDSRVLPGEDETFSIVGDVRNGCAVSGASRSRLGGCRSALSDRRSSPRKPASAFSAISSSSSVRGSAPSRPRDPGLELAGVVASTPAPLDPRLVRVFCNLGLAYKACGDLPKAILTHRRCLELARKSNDCRAKVVALSAIGECLQATGRGQEALSTFARQLEVAESSTAPEIERRALLATSYGNIGVALRKTGLGELLDCSNYSGHWYRGINGLVGVEVGVKVFEVVNGL